MFTFFLGIIVLNCVGWIIYGSMLQDYFIFVCNIVGLILGLFYLLTSMVLIGSIEGLGSWRYRYLEILLFIGVALYSIIGMILGNSSFSSNMCRILVATTANSCTIIYYASPCSTMYEVMKTKNSSSLYSPMISANICTSILWFIYGYLSIHDPFVYIPNGIGILLSMFQFSLVIIYPNYSRLEQKYEKVDNGDSNK